MMWLLSRLNGRVSVVLLGRRKTASSGPACGGVRSTRSGATNSIDCKCDVVLLGPLLHVSVKGTETPSTSRQSEYATVSVPSNDGIVARSGRSVAESNVIV